MTDFIKICPKCKSTNCFYGDGWHNMMYEEAHCSSCQFTITGTKALDTWNAMQTFTPEKIWQHELDELKEYVERCRERLQRAEKDVEEKLKTKEPS